ncbi:mucin-19 [Drosophila miranda]|uniref:mucin-19 n=1 Tax=Drosophila miranda TaxID=7229 RepID=UPI00143F5074|nr:mucin-19 [Drosophila miranda]
MKIHRSNESFCCCWLLFLVALLVAAAATSTTTVSETQTNATNGAIRQPAAAAAVPAEREGREPRQLQLGVQQNATAATAAAASDGESRTSAEILGPSDVDAVGDKPTTYRPSGANRPSIAPPLNSAQDRERKLMNVLAARRTALHRGGFRTRIGGTTGRSGISQAAAAAAAVESTSKSPSDPRSVCIRNCTKNFTRRTTASCMRQCANFTRMAMAGTMERGGQPGANSSSAVPKGSMKVGGGGAAAGGAADRDTNEILFSDESSHGLFVVAKEQNDTLNHIADGTKPPVVGKAVRGKVTSVEHEQEQEQDDDEEDDELKPYVYFGAKLPPIRPGGLTIKAAEGDDEHPRVLEVSVAQSTTPTPSQTLTTSTSTTSRPTASTRRPLTAVERSRSRYKYHMRERGIAAAADPPPPPAVIAPPVSRTRYVGSGRSTAGLQSETEVAKPVVVRRVVAPKAAQPSSSTPLIITVLSAEEDTTLGQAEVQQPEATTTTSTSTTTTAKPTTTSTTTTQAPPPPSTTTTKRTTTKAPTTTTTTTTAKTTTSTTPGTTSSTTTIHSVVPTTPKRKSIIEKDTELIRALGPALTQEINIEDQNNLIIFCNNTSDCGATPRTPHTQLSHTTDSSPKILRTTVLTSVRSTVHPRTTTSSSSSSTSTTQAAPPADVYIGVVESSSSASATPLDISSTIVIANERDVDLEMRRMNLVTLVLVAVGVIPLAAIILYLVRNYVVRRRAKKHGEVFDVCITDQQPISPVKKVDSKYQLDEEEDEVDHHQHHHQQQQQQQHHHAQHQAMPMSQASRDANHNRYTMDDKTSLASEYQDFDRSNIRLKSLLGEGNFGQVWKAEADDLSGHFGATRIVAVKTIRACSAQVSLKDEANIMRKLGSHQNVVTLLGACVESEPHMLIMEYAMRGRLLSLLRAARSATNILPASVPGGRSLAPLSPRTLAGFALDIACGMEYIAGRRIVHRDLAARNVLLDHNGMCKICDFGMSIDLDAERMRKEQEKNAANDILRSNALKFKFDFGSRYILQHWQHTFGQGQSNGHCSKEHHHSHGGHDTIGKRHALPIRWMAPESLQYHMFTTETDIWAFGIVLWEIATLGSTPYSQQTGREVIRRVPQGLRPELPKESRHEFYNLMSRCWHKDPHMRPSFAQSRLEITRSLHKWVDDDSAASDYMDVSGFSEDLEHGVVYFNHRISEFECEI